MTPMSTGALQQMIEQTDEKSEAGHKRLREDFDKIEARFSSLAAAQAEMRLSLLKASTPDVTSLRLTPGTVFGIVMFVVSLGGGYLTLRDSIANVRQDLADARKDQKLQELKINELTNKVLDAIRRLPSQGVNP